MKTLAFLLILSSCQIVKAPLVYCLGGKYSVIIDEKKIPSYATEGEKNTADVALENHSFTNEEIIFSLRVGNQPAALKVQTKKNEIGSYVGKIQFNGEEIDASCSLQNLES